MRSALLAMLLGGCLIVRTQEEVVDDPCPELQPERLVTVSGPFVLGDAVYFIAGNGTVSRLAFDGGPVSELTTAAISTRVIAADATDLYWSRNDAIVRKPLAGGAAYAIAEGFPDVTALVVDDTSVVWASRSGLSRWDKSSKQVDTLDTAELVLGLGSFAGSYYYSDTHGDRVRKAPPATDVTEAHFPGPLVVDDRGVYFFEAGDPFVDFGGALRLVPVDGGEVVTTAKDLAPVLALAADDNNLYFTSAYDSRYRVKQVSRFGGSVRTLACGVFVDQQVPVAVAGGFVYFADGRFLYRIDQTAPVPL
jgi:hypothetical protein